MYITLILETTKYGRNHSVRSLNITIIRNERACASVYGVFALELVQTVLNAVLVCHWYPWCLHLCGMNNKSPHIIQVWKRIWKFRPLAACLYLSNSYTNDVWYSCRHCTVLLCIPDIYLATVLFVDLHCDCIGAFKTWDASSEKLSKSNTILS